MKLIIPFLFAFAFLLMGFECGADPVVCDPGTTQTCTCPGGELGSQVCSSDGQRWGGCQCRSTAPDAGTRSCLPAGRVILGCGCHGPAYEGQIRTATGCCSRQAVSTAQGCFGYCAGGTLPWGNICL